MNGNIKLITLAMLVSLTAGCKKTPSDEDIKNSIAKAFEQCPIIEVMNFEKKNGYADEKNGHYIASVQYDLHVTPPKGNDLLLNKYTEIESDSKKSNIESKALDNEIYNYQEKLNETDEIIYEIYNKHTKNLEVIYPDVTNHDFVREIMDQEYREKNKNAKSLFDAELKKRLNSDLEYNKAIAERDDFKKIMHLKQEEKNKFIHESKIRDKNMHNYLQKMKQAYNASCRSSYVPQEIDRKIRFAKSPISLHQEFSITYNAEFNLIKTDNGWMIKEFYDL